MKVCKECKTENVEQLHKCGKCGKDLCNRCGIEVFVRIPGLPKSRIYYHEDCQPNFTKILPGYKEPKKPELEESKN